MSQRHDAMIVGLGVLIVLGFASAVRADLLFRGRDPIKIGLGTQDGATIKWTNCSRQKPETFHAPPYALDQADNCAVGPPAFGLECRGDSCRVVDEQKLRKYFPSVHNGESVTLHITEEAVELQYQSRTLRLER